MSELLGAIEAGLRVLNWAFGKPPTCIICNQDIEKGFSIKEIHEHIDRKYYSYMNSSWIIFDYICDNKIEDYEYRDTFERRAFLQGEDLKWLNYTVICEKCCINRFKKLEEDFTKTYIRMNQVKTYPASYDGTFDLSDVIPPKVETYRFSGGKWNTVNKMKFWADWEGFDVIYNITYDYENGTATGVFAKLK